METPAIENLRTLGQQVKDLRAQMTSLAKEALAEGTKAVFEEYGDILHSFSWTQFAPSFNDGDPCEFSMHEVQLVAKCDVQSKYEDDEDYEDDGEGSPAFSTYSDGTKVRETLWDDKPNPNFDQRYADCAAACEIIWQVVDETTSRAVFGDSVKVIFTPEGVDVEEYWSDY